MCFQTCLSFPQSVGIIGGRPNHAHWFVGYVGEHLDTHYVVIIFHAVLFDYVLRTTVLHNI